MQGETIHSLRRFPLVATLLLGMAGGLLAAALIRRSYNDALGALAPFLLALMLHLFRSRPFRATFTEDGLRVETSGQLIPFASMRGVEGLGQASNPFRAGGESFPIQIIHDEGLLWIPRRLNVPSDRVYRFLYETLHPQLSRDLPPQLADYRNTKEKQFGADMVLSYQAWVFPVSPFARRQLTAVCLALFGTGVLWSFLGHNLLEANLVVGLDGGMWIALGFALIVGSPLVFAVLLMPLGWRPSSGKKHKAGLVLTPEGLRYSGGWSDVEVRWDEVFDLVLRSDPHNIAPELRAIVEVFFLPLAVIEPLADLDPDLPTIAQVLSQVSSFAILDSYDHPLPLIYEKLQEYREAALTGTTVGGSRRTHLFLTLSSSYSKRREEKSSQQQTDAIIKPPDNRPGSTDGPIKPA